MGIRWNRKFKAFQRKSHARRLSADVPTRSQARGNWLRRRAKPVEHQVLVSLYKPSSAKADVRESCLVTLLFFHFYFVLQWGTTIKWKTPRCNFRWSLYFFRKRFAVHWCAANIVLKNIASNRRTEAEKHVFWNTSDDRGRVAQLSHVPFRRGGAKIRIVSNMVLWCRPSLYKPLPLKKYLFLSFRFISFVLLVQSQNS